MICPHYRRGVVKGCGLNSGSVLVWMDRLRALRDSRPVSCPVWWVLHPTVPDGPLLPLRPARESDRRGERGERARENKRERGSRERDRKERGQGKRERGGKESEIGSNPGFISHQRTQTPWKANTAPLTMYLFTKYTYTTHAILYYTPCSEVYTGRQS